MVITFLLLFVLPAAGAPGNGASYDPAISADGRYVAFESLASDLVAGDTGGTRDIFVRDRNTGTNYRVSLDSAGVEGNDGSWGASLSDDGRYVAFHSFATNLVAGDTNGKQDVFVRDRTTGTTRRVSVSSAGGEGDNPSYSSSLSADGRYVAFASDATNLVAGDTNAREDIFVRDRHTGTTYRVSVSSTGAEADGYSYSPSISDDGMYVVFESDATNLVAGDTNAARDVFVRDRAHGTTYRVSRDSAGAEGNGVSENAKISADGRYVAFHSSATNLVAGDTNAVRDVFVRDRTTGTTTRASKDSAGAEGDDQSLVPSLSADGRYVTFYAAASNLVAGDTNGKYDVFVRDRTTGTTTRASKDSAGAEGNGDSSLPGISNDGRYVVFASLATNLVAGDTNGVKDIFVRDRSTGTTYLVSRS
jgi:Tol biopolymer transport system component